MTKWEKFDKIEQGNSSCQISYNWKNTFTNTYILPSCQFEGSVKRRKLIPVIVNMLFTLCNGFLLFEKPINKLNSKVDHSIQDDWFLHLVSIMDIYLVDKQKKKIPTYLQIPIKLSNYKDKLTKLEKSSLFFLDM